MTRALPFVTAAVLAAAACSAPEAPQATATPEAAPPAREPVAVFVQVPQSPDPAVEGWAQALVAAIESGEGQLVLASTPEEAAAVVRVDAVEAGLEAGPEPEGEGEVLVMRGALLVGGSAREFNLAYRGDARPQAEALARSLRRFAAEGAAALPTGAPEGSGDAEPQGPAADEDQG